MPPSCFLRSTSALASLRPLSRSRLTVSSHHYRSSCFTVLGLWLLCLSALLVPSLTSAQSNASASGSGSSTGSNPAIAPISLSTAFLRILGALGLGSVIGIEREITNITRRLRGMAGIRTHAVICTGSCLIQLVSVYAYANVSGYNSNRDPSRLAAQAVSGIGFVGAGAILKGGENVIYGLTSAASIWLVMGVGLAVGVGYWAVACLTVVLVVVVMVATKRGEHFVFGRRYGPGYTAEMEVVSKSGPDILQHIMDSVGKQLNITTVSLERQHTTLGKPHTQPNNPPAQTAMPSTTTTTTTPPSDVTGSPAAASSTDSSHSSLCAKFVVELDNCSRHSFLCRLQLTVMLLCEDDDVYKVDTKNVREVANGPTHRLKWSVPNQQEREQMEQEMNDLTQEVRERRVRRRKKLTEVGRGADVEDENAVRVDV